MVPALSAAISHSVVVALNPTSQYCTATSFCGICIKGYTVNNGSCSLSCNLSFCSGCSQSDFCSSCNQSTFVNGTTTYNVTLFNGACSLCLDPNCVACKSNQVCGTCVNISFSVSPQSGLCVICSDPNCVQCNNSFSPCIQCINSQYMVN
jgi:hypothetical protein